MEALYQYLWRHRLFGNGCRRLCDGREVRILSPGVLNTDAGPDFSSARIMLDGTSWCGNVEIHQRASDWYHHGHDADPAYNNVLLHVVAVDDARVKRVDGTEIPQLVIALPDGFTESYGWLKEGLGSVNCHKLVKTIPPLERTFWLERTGTERLQQKANHVADIMKWTGGDWQRTLFIILGRALGFGLNAEPMEMLARALPLNFAARHSDNPVQIEAMLFGMAGMLNPAALTQEEYYQYLCREYRFLSLKYNLRPLRDMTWKFARTRPQNFPYRRIAMLASSLAGGFAMAGDLLRLSDSLDALRGLFSLNVSDYWSRRFSFGGTQMSTSINPSVSSINLLIINAAVPFLYCYGKMRGESKYEQRAIDLLTQLPAEQNTFVRSWGSAGLKAENAFESQALLYLRKSYCDVERCLDCRFAQIFMSHYLKQKNAAQSQS